MKILYLLFANGVAGAEKHLLYLLPALKKYGINGEVLVICLKKNIPFLEDYCAELNDMGIKSAIVPVKSRWSIFSTAKFLSEYAKTNYIKVVHSHLIGADLIAVLAKKIYSRQLIIISTKHGYEEEYLLQYGLGNKKTRHNLYYFLSKAIIKNTDHNLSVSEALSTMYKELGLLDHKMKYIHHGISQQVIKEGKLKLSESPYIMSVGRLYPIKGQTYLLQALPAVIKKFPGLKLFLIGVGPSKEELTAEAVKLKVIDHIEFVGFEEPKNYTAQCQIMVLPSLFESFGLVVIESFALRIPVIAFDVEAGNEIIDNTITGMLVPRGDVGALEEKIIYLLEFPEERKRIIENAYSMYLTYYNVDRMAKETAAWYYSILDTFEKTKMNKRV